MNELEIVLLNTTFQVPVGEVYFLETPMPFFQEQPSALITERVVAEVLQS